MSQYIVVISASSSLLSSSSHWGWVGSATVGGGRRWMWGRATQIQLVFPNFGGDEQNYCLFLLNFVKISFQYRRMFVILLSPSNLAMVMRDLEAGENLSTVVLISSIIYGGVVDFEGRWLSSWFLAALYVYICNWMSNAPLSIQSDRSGNARASGQITSDFLTQGS